MPDDDQGSAEQAEAQHVLVVIPTYNEHDNLPLILGRLDAITAPGFAVDVLVVDDGSPDGTGEVADRYAETHPHVFVLHRAAKAGLGAAYRAGFSWALAREYDVIVEMDADGSHAPEQLPRLLHATRHAALVIGSRYVAGGAVVNWPAHRQALSKVANMYARLALGAPLADMTAGFRAYRAEVLRSLALVEVASQGYCFQVDLAWRTLQAGFRVAEVPITFTEREIGASKMNTDIMQEALVNIARWGLRHRYRQLSRLWRR